MTGEAVLKGFAYPSAIYTRFVDGSVQFRVEELNTFQRGCGEGAGTELVAELARLFVAHTA